MSSAKEVVPTAYQALTTSVPGAHLTVWAYLGHACGGTLFPVGIPLFEPCSVRRSQRSCVRRLPLGGSSFCGSRRRRTDRGKVQHQHPGRGCLYDRWVRRLARVGLVATAKPGELSGHGVVGAKQAGAPYKPAANHASPTANKAAAKPENNARAQSARSVPAQHANTQAAEANKQSTTRPVSSLHAVAAPRAQEAQHTGTHTQSAPAHPAARQQTAPREQAAPRQQSRTS